MLGPKSPAFEGDASKGIYGGETARSAHHAKVQATASEAVRGGREVAQAQHQGRRA
jgi:hypothetical protein